MTGTGLGLKDAAEEKGPIPLGALRPRDTHEGFWNGLNPAGYKLVRRVPHARKGSPWIGTKPYLKETQECWSRKLFHLMRARS